MSYLLPALLILAAAPHAPPAPPAEQDIIVTGRGLAAAPGEQVYDVVVLDRARLTGSASGRLDEILKEVPGFQLFRRSDARSANPTSQGATLRALGGNASSRALLILDGVPQSDPFGGWINWPAYDPRRLGEVRVLRGGGSGAAGPGALAGTIEMASADAADLAGPHGGIAYGSRDSLDADAGLGLRIGDGFLAMSGNYGRGDGFVPVVVGQRGTVDRPSPYEHASLSLRALAPVGGAEVQASGSLFTDRRERGTAFTENDTDGADASLRLVAPRLSLLFYVQHRDYYNSFASVGAGRASVTQASEQYAVPSTGLGARAEWRPRLGSLDLRLGGDWRETRGETRELFSFVGGTGTRRRIAGGETRTTGAFAEAVWENGPLTLTGGGRIDRWRIADGFLDETLIATGAPLAAVRYPDRGGWEPTARAGAARRIGAALTLRGAAYLGWRLPTLNELYRPFRVGADATAANADLAPERLRGIEAGVDYRPLPDARIGVTLFSNRLRGGIANVTLGQGPGTFAGVGFVAAGGEYRRRQNLDAIVSRGIEIDGRWASGAWTLSGGYSYADADVRASGPALPLDGLRPAQTPRHGAAATLAWSRGGADASLTARHVGGQYEDDTNSVILPAATTFDAAAALPLGRRVALQLRAENIADKLVVAGISGAGLVERATPRTLWIGLRLDR